VERYRPEKDPEALERLLAGYAYHSPLSWFRSIRPFAVSVPKHEFDKLERQGDVRPHESGLFIYSGPYNDLWGIGFGDVADPADLIV
jgi:hypothetical protein